MWLALSLGWQMAKCDRKLAQILSKNLFFFLRCWYVVLVVFFSFWFYMRAADKNVLTRSKYEYWNRFVIIKAFFIDINVSWFWEFLYHGTKSWIFQTKSKGTQRDTFWLCAKKYFVVFEKFWCQKSDKTFWICNLQVKTLKSSWHQ